MPRSLDTERTELEGEADSYAWPLKVILPTFTLTWVPRASVWSEIIALPGCLVISVLIGRTARKSVLVV